MADTVETQATTAASATVAPTSAIVIDETETDRSSYMTIGERLKYYGIILTNATADQTILSALSAFNYTQEKIAAGSQLLERVFQADAQNTKAYGEQYAATQTVEQEYQEAYKPYMTSLGVARIAFKNNTDAQNALVLKGKRAGNLSNWIHEAEIFYRNILATGAYLSRMEEFGRTRSMIEAEYKEVKDVQNAASVQKKETGEAIESTSTRNAIMAELDSWMSDFIGIIRIALQDMPDSLTKLGL